MTLATVPSYNPKACPEADILARTLITTGVLDEEALRRHAGDGLSTNEYAFYFFRHVATGLAAHAADTIVQGKGGVFDSDVFHDTVTRFAKGALCLPPRVYTYALDVFITQLASKSDALSERKEHPVENAPPSVGYKLGIAAQLRIIKLLGRDGGFTPAHISLTSEVFAEQKSVARAPSFVSDRGTAPGWTPFPLAEHDLSLKMENDLHAHEVIHSLAWRLRPTEASLPAVPSMQPGLKKKSP